MSARHFLPVCLFALVLIPAATVTPADAGVSGPTAVQGMMLDRQMAVERAKLLASDGEDQDVFGNAIALDGDTALVGAPWDQDNGEFSGSAYVFVLENGLWVEQAKLVPSDGKPFGLFAYSVALDGDSAVVGALGSAGDWGSAYVFTRSGGVWSEQAKLLPFDGAEIDYLGHSVAIDGDTVVVGAPDWNYLIDPGSVYVFTRTGELWTHEAKLEVPGVQAGHKFGHDVTLDGDTFIVGAIGVGPDYRGAAYVFTRTDEGWPEPTKLQPTPGPVNDYFGFGVVLDGDTAIIGAPRDDLNGEGSGAAYVYTRQGDLWVDQARLRPADGASSEWFGKITALDGDTAIIGAPYDDDNGHWSGSAYMYTRSDGVWTERTKLLPFNGRADEGFGFALALDGSAAIIGAPFEEPGPGRAHVFRLRTDRTEGASALDRR